VAVEAIGSNAAWVKSLGQTPQTPIARARWLREVSTIAAYRDHWHITEDGIVGSAGDVQAPNRGANARSYWRRPSERPPSATALRSPVPPGNGSEISTGASTCRRGHDAVAQNERSPSAGRVETHHGQEGDFGDHDAPTQADDGDFATSDELIGEGPRDPE
jgi:hypothetical protein